MESTANGTPATGSNSRFEPSTYRPRPVDDVLLFDRSESENDARFVVTTEASPEVCVLSTEEKHLWVLMDGERTVDDICVTYLEERQALVLSQVFALIERLWSQGLLQEDPCFVTTMSSNDAVSRKRLDRAKLQIPIPGSAATARIAAAVLRPLQLHAVPTMIIAGVLAVLGLCMVSTLDHPPFFRLNHSYELPVIGAIPASYGYGLALLVILHLLCSFAREFFLAAVSGTFTGRFVPLHFGVAYNVPAFFHPRKWRQTLPLRRRLVASFAGIAFELVAAAVCALVLYLGWWRDGSELIHKLMLVLYIRCFLHFSPFFGSDFNFVMGDWIQIPGFRRKAIRFFRSRFVDTLMLDTKLQRHQRFFLTYIVATALWIILVVHFGGSQLRDDTQLKSDLLNMGNTQTDPLLFVVVLFFIIPVMLSFVVALFWLGCFLWQFLSTHPAFEHVNKSLAIAAIAIAVGIGATRFMPKDLFAFMLAAACLVLFCGGLFLIFQSLRKSGHSAIGMQMTFVGLAVAAGAVMLINDLVVDAYLVTTATSLMMFICLIPPVAIGMVKKQFVPAFRRAAFALPLALLFVGLALLIIASWQIVHVSEIQAFATVMQAKFIGLAFLPMAFVAYHAHLKEVNLSSDVLIIDQIDGNLPKSLAAMFDFVRENLGSILECKFGYPCPEMIERRVNDQLGGQKFAFDQPFQTTDHSPEEVGAAMRDVVREIDRALTHYFSQGFSDMVFEQVFKKLNCECFLTFHRYVIRDTRFGRPLNGNIGLTSDRCLDVLRSINFFQELPPEDTAFLGRRMTLGRYEPGELIVRIGDEADSCYIIFNGQAQIEVTDIAGDGDIIAFLNAGDFFGESALIEASHRMANVRAASAMTVLSIRRHDIELLGDRHPESVEKLKEQLGILHFLFRIRLFADLPAELVRSLLPKLSLKTFADNETLFRKGDEGNHFYLIRSGAIDIIDETDGTERSVGQLGVHDYFGEIALIRNVPRTMTARAVGETQTLKLGKAATLQLIEGSKLFAANINRAGEDRIAGNDRSKPLGFVR